MFRRPRWPRVDALAAVLLLWCATVLPGSAAAQGVRHAAAALPIQRLVLAVTLDGTAAPEPVVVRRQGPLVTMRAADLRALGLAVPGDAADVALADIAGLEVAIDEAAQTLTLARRDTVQRVRVEATDARPRALPVTRGDWGAAVNYDAAVTRAGRHTTAGALLDGVLYSPSGYFFAGAVVSSDRAPNQRRVQRLDTGFTTGDPGTTRRLTIGDVITGATEQSRPVRLGGIQLATDFALRPDLITFPVPAINGSAAVPSAVDLIVNGSRRSAGSVRAGQFAVTDMPVQTGVNTVTVATRDALGRETRQTVSTYISRALLAPGLTAFSAEAGLVRSGYATAQDRYAGLAGAGSLRIGVSERLTAETHLELGTRVRAGTAGAALGLGNLGMVSGGLGLSSGGAGSRAGVQLALGYERIGRPVSVSAHYQRQSSGWYDLASDGGATTRTHLFSLTVGFDLATLGNLGVAVIDQGRGRIARPLDGAQRVGRSYVMPAASLVTATYSVRLQRRLSLVANGGVDLRARRSGYLSVGALLVMGRRSSGYAGALTRRGGTSATVELGQTAVEPGDWGFHVGAAAGGVDRVAGDLSYQGAAGYYAVQAERANGVSAARASARGAVIVGRAGLLATDRQTGSFAVIDTHGQAGVPVFRDNRRVGITDRQGRFVVANLPAYQPTKISLDPLLLDDRVVVDRTETWVVPAARSAVAVRFAMRASIAATIRLVGADGAPIAAGARAVLNGGATLPVGMDGEVYAEDLRAGNELIVRGRDGETCTARFPAAASSSPVQRIGPIPCRPAQLAAR